MTEHSQSAFLSLYLFVADRKKTRAICRFLGFNIQRVSLVFARANWDSGTVIEWGTGELTASYDKAFKPPGVPSNNTLNFH